MSNQGAGITVDAYTHQVDASDFDFSPLSVDVDLLLEQLARTLAALHRAGFPVSAVNRPATGRPPFAMIILEDVNFEGGVFYRHTASAAAEDEEE